MFGMHSKTGEKIEGIECLRQYVLDILTTPIGSRIMRRDYGSRLMAMIDRPMNQLFIAQLQAAVAESLTNYVPSLRLTRVQVTSEEPGQLILTIEGYLVSTGDPILLRETIN